MRRRCIPRRIIYVMAAQGNECVRGARARDAHWPKGESRRQFIQKAGVAAAAMAGAGLLNLPTHARESNERVVLVLDAASPVVKQPPVQWAAEQLREALAARGIAAELFEALDQTRFSQLTVLVTGRAWFHPALRPGWRGQPYVFVRQS